MIKKGRPARGKDLLQFGMVFKEKLTEKEMVALFCECIEAGREGQLKLEHYDFKRIGDVMSPMYCVGMEDWVSIKGWFSER